MKLVAKIYGSYSFAAGGKYYILFTKTYFYGIGRRRAGACAGRVGGVAGRRGACPDAPDVPEGVLRPCAAAAKGVPSRKRRRCAKRLFRCLKFPLTGFGLAFSRF